MTELNIKVSENTVLQNKKYYPQWRLFKDKLAQYGIALGGVGVIVAIVLIFFYLLYVVYPLFLSAKAEQVSQYAVPQSTLGKTLFLSMEEHNEICVRFTDRGEVIFFACNDGKIIKTEKIAIPEQVEITAFAHGRYDKGVVIYGFSNGRVVVAKQHYKTTYPNGKRMITPELEYPLGREPIEMDKNRRAIELLAVRLSEDENTIIAKTVDGRLLLTAFNHEDSLFDDDTALTRQDVQIDLDAGGIAYLLLDKEQRNLFLANRQGELTHVDVSDKNQPVLKQAETILKPYEQITAMTFLNGDLSLLVGDSSGVLSQWSLLRDEQNQSGLKKLRAFKVSDHAIVAISPEQRRKGLIVADAAGLVGIYYTTSERELVRDEIEGGKPIALALSPRANAFLLQTANQQIHFWAVENEYPEVSWKSLWQKVWYESYPKPEYIWQSSSASNDFEPKLSLMPLTFGTLKAAFYAMVLAIPLALMGAIYTAYFMAPQMRQWVKPGIEIMEALPTVILGFLAGLWLAPLVEVHLLAIFSLLMIVPLAVILFAWVWQYLPKTWRQKIPQGWDAAILIPVIIVAAWVAFLMAPGLQTLFFNGDMQWWMKRVLGIDYDQRNSIVVGLAMGFAVIPTIFSIAEDAIFSVPKHLTTGSLALGATTWQTMSRVVLLTASPGIFSAVMIGFGRAVGETMIVLMATGNTPVMDLSIFQGMRTLSANVAVELPEAEVDSTHYRVLFLASLVLFVFTFVFNTLAEIVRQNLRQKYSSL